MNFSQDKRDQQIFCVYRHIRLDTNQPFYVGIGDIKRPYKTKGRNKHWLNIYNICNKNIKVDILFENQTWNFCCDKEKEFIKIYGRRDLNLGSLCNYTNGGEGPKGRIKSAEEIEKHRKSIVGFKHTEEAKAKIKFNSNNMSIETIEKLRKGSTGRKLSEEARNKISDSKKKLTFQNRENIKIAAINGWKTRKLNLQLNG